MRYHRLFAVSQEIKLFAKIVEGFEKLASHSESIELKPMKIRLQF